MAGGRATAKTQVAVDFLPKKPSIKFEILKTNQLALY
jgi:hypothetical protein